MTINRRIEPALPEILAELGAGPVPDYADLVVERAGRTRQRPTWVFPGRWLPVGQVAFPMPRLRPILIVVLIVALAIAVAAAYIGTRPRLPDPFGPAQNGALVYASEGDIFAGTPGGSSTPIVAGPDYDFNAFYSPDGTKVSFYRRADQDLNGATDLMVARADGSDLRRITPRPLKEIPWAASWTPDGSAIAVLTNQRLDGHLEFFDTTGAVEPKVIDVGIRIDTFAFQPPSGRRILFTGQVDNRIGLYAMDRDGGNLTVLVPPYLKEIAQNTGDYWNFVLPVADLRNAIWSPDGQQIVFQQYEVTAHSRQMRLFMMDSNGRDLHPITTPIGDSIDANPVWSPDGTRIAFLRYQLDRNEWTYAVLRLSDGLVTTTGPTIPDGTDPDAFSPGLAVVAWSPDSTKLFAVEDSNRHLAYILDPDGGRYETLPWTIDTPKSWGLTGLNGLDLGSWQRVASP